MANTFTPTDVYSIVNEMSKEMWGANSALTAFDTSSFVSVGEAMLRTGYENTLNALGAVIGKYIVSARPYRGKFRIIMRTADEFGDITQKTSYYSTDLEPAEDWNTDLNPQQLVDGSSVDPWKISKVYPLQVVFAGKKITQKSYTRFLYQLKGAFVSPEAFATYFAGMLVQIGNDMEVEMDAENRLQVINAIGATYNVGAPRQKVNLTAEYNAFYGTSYTTAQLLTTYYKEFIEFFVMRLKGDMELMSEYNSLFHIYPAKNDDSGNALTLNRHTPAEDRRLLLYMPRIRQAESTVFPALFDTSYLRLDNFESVEYWMNPNVPEAIDVVPNQLNVANGQAVNGNRVQLDHVLAVLFDREALATAVKVEEVLSTNINARGSYVNQVYHWAKMHSFDQTENMVIYYMAD